MKQDKKPASRKNEKQKSVNDFPGYPHYKNEEDIMNSSAEERIDINLDNTSKNIPIASNKENIPVYMSPEDEELEITPGNEADVSDEEKEDLEREGLQDRLYAPDDLDIPGSELDDESEEIGEEDEENNYYSLGGDDKENLEENT
jgi:hypothetical protein